jgi:hypothetical protein
MKSLVNTASYGVAIPSSVKPYSLISVCVSVVNQYCLCILGGLLPRCRWNENRNFRAEDTRELLAAFVSFQRCQPTQPPCENVISAHCSRNSACHFSGKYATYAILQH